MWFDIKRVHKVYLTVNKCKQNFTSIKVLSESCSLDGHKNNWLGFLLLLSPLNLNLPKECWSTQSLKYLLHNSPLKHTAVLTWVLWFPAFELLSLSFSLSLPPCSPTSLVAEKCHSSDDIHCMTSCCLSDVYATWSVTVMSLLRWSKQ